jgi:hypothetical protein
MKNALVTLTAISALVMALAVGCSHKKTNDADNMNDAAMTSAPLTAQPATDVSSTSAPTTNMDNSGNMAPNTVAADENTTSLGASSSGLGH